VRTRSFQALWGAVEPAIRLMNLDRNGFVGDAASVGTESESDARSRWMERDERVDRWGRQ
jgi:hypothetical protein